MSNSELKQKTTSGFLWSAVDKFGQQAIAMIVRIIIARILSPEDFGLIAVLLVFNVFANILQDSGFSAALIRKKDASKTDYSTIFYFNIFIGIVIYLILFFSAPLIAKFYNQPIFINLSRIIFLSFLFNSFGVIQNVLIIKSLDFRKNSVISALSNLLSGIVAVIMVYRGFGIWSLAAQVVLASFFRTVILWIRVRFIPLWKFDFGVLKELFPFSSKMLVTQVMNQSSNIIYANVIGKRFNFTQLGYYEEAKKYLAISIDSLSGIISNVAFPVLSSINHQKERMLNVFRKLIRVCSFITFPTIMLFGVIAQPLILFLLTEKWAAVAPMLQVLCINGLFYPLVMVNNSLLKTEGKSGAIFMVELVKNILLIASIFLTVSYGVMYLIWGSVVVNTLSYLYYAYQTQKYSGYSVLTQLKDIMPYFVLAAVCFLPTLFLQQLTGNYLLQILFQTVAGGGLYLILCKLLGSKIIEEAQNLLMRKTK